MTHIEKMIQRYGSYVISQDTLLPIDLIPAMADALEELDPESLKLIMYKFDGELEEIAEDPELACELIDYLEDALMDASPEGYYFGSQPGDGSCFGFWKLEEWIFEESVANGGSK